MKDSIKQNKDSITALEQSVSLLQSQLSDYVRLGTVYDLEESMILLDICARVAYSGKKLKMKKVRKKFRKKVRALRLCRSVDATAKSLKNDPSKLNNVYKALYGRKMPKCNRGPII